MNGDEALGRVVLDKLHTQVELWQLLFEDIPIFVVNTVNDGDVTQDIHWYVSQFPEALKSGKEWSEADFRERMEKEFNVRYDDDGSWNELG